jgi:hypothetical protein
MYGLLKRVLVSVTAAGLLVVAARQASADTIVVDFEDLSLPPSSYYNGSDLAGGFTSQGAFFNNKYNPNYGTWSGWSYSNMKDVTTPGFMNQYSAYKLPDGGGNMSANYGVAYTFNPGDAKIVLPDGYSPQSASITNTTYAGLSMLYGDQFAKKFGGPDGTDPDWFLLTISGFDASGNFTGSVDFYLADYRDPDPANKYIISDWTTVDLTPLGNAQTLSFGLTSTDNDPVFGMNTPAYFAIDNLVVSSDGRVASNPEPGSLVLAAVGLSALLAVRWLRKRVR